MSTGHEAWSELAAGYALNALEPEDEAAFEQHLPGCDACRRTLADFTAVAGQLAYAAEPVSPPPALHDRIMAALPDTGPGGLVVTANDLERQRERRRGRAGFDRSRRALAFSAAAALALVAFTGWSVKLNAERNQARTEAARMRRVVAELGTTGARRAQLVSATGVDGAFFVGSDKVWLVVDGLEPNDRSRSTYVVWWQDKSQALRPVTTFDVRNDEPLIAEVRLPAPADQIAGLAISHEPGRTMPAQPSEGAIAQARVV